MNNEFINPNWHIILIHYPIGLLTIGLIVEIISVFKPRGGLRAAGRWMIGIGAALAIPTLTSGLYAFRDTVTNDPMYMSTPWQELKADSSWNQAQWQFITRHIWFNAIGTGLCAVILFLWLANSDRVRRKLYWVLLPTLAATWVLFGLGAWHGGEMVYRYGTAVQRVNPNLPSAKAEEEKKGVDFYAQPLQVHLLFAGLAVATSVIGISLMFRRWDKGSVESLDDVLAAGLNNPAAEDPAGDRYRTSTALSGEVEKGTAIIREPPRVYPGLFYLGATILAVITAFFGAWSTAGELTKEALGNLFHLVREPDHRRLLVHSITGVSIVVLPLVLAAVGRIRTRLIPLGFTLLLLAAVGLQVWFGVALLYDGHEGPLFGFAPAGQVEHEHHHEGPTAQSERATHTGTAVTAPTTRSATTHSHH